MKTLLFFALLLCAFAANAATYDCTTSCNFVTDAYPTSGPVPTSCRLYSSGVLAASGGTQIVAAGVRCFVPAKFVAGSYTVTMRAVDAAGKETADSAPFAFASAATVQQLLPPVNVRIE